MVRSRKHTAAFTLIELIVSISIFAIMTALVVVKYGSFNNSVLLTNAAYDVALAIRTAQTYGLSVRGDSGDQDFNKIYGVQFRTPGGSFACDSSGDPQADFRLIRATDVVGGSPCPVDVITNYYLKSGMYISGIGTPDAAGNYTDGYPNPFNTLEITFKRPDPDAQIRFGRCSPGGICPQDPKGSNVIKVRITLKSATGEIRTLSVRENGQISVDN